MTDREIEYIRQRIAMIGARVAVNKLQPRLLRKASDQSAEEVVMLAASLLASASILRLQAIDQPAELAMVMRRYSDQMPALVDRMLSVWVNKFGPLPMEVSPDGFMLPYAPPRILLALMKAYVVDTSTRVPANLDLVSCVNAVTALMDATRNQLPKQE